MHITQKFVNWKDLKLHFWKANSLSIIILLPIWLWNFVHRKFWNYYFSHLVKGGGERGARLINSIPLFMSCLLNFTKRFRTGSYATGIARRQFLRYKRALPFLTQKTSFFHWFLASVYVSWLCKDTQISSLIHCNHNFILTFRQSENRMPQ